MSNSVAQPSTQSNVSTPPTNASSAWSRGPPGTTGSNASSNPSSAIATPIQTTGSPLPPAAGQTEIQNGAQRGQGATNGGTPISAGGPHSRKGSLMVGGGVDIKRGNLAFGTVDSPNPLLSSSPAVPSLTGSHLADNVKSFGSIDADGSSDPSAVKGASRASAAASPLPAGSPAPKKELNLHSLFGAKPQQNGITPSMASSVHSPNQANVATSTTAARRQSMSQNGPSGVPPAAYPYQNYPGQPHLRPPQGNGLPASRSPMSPHAMAQPQFGNQMPVHLQQGFRPPQGQQMQQGAPQVRPNGIPQGMMGQQRNSMMMGQPYGMPGYPMMPFPQGQYYGQYTPYDSPQYAQWAAAQHQPGFNMGVSPRGPPASLGQSGTSPSPLASTLPTSGGPSPVPTPAVRPGALGLPQAPSSSASNNSIPSTPSRPTNAQSPAPFSPSAMSSTSTPFSMSTAASSFTPTARPSRAIVIKRDDGSVIDIKAVAGSKPAAASSPAPAKPAAPAGDDAPAAPQVKKPTLPVIVRLESEDQKKKRLEEEAQKKRIREEEAREAEERKERNERRAREQAEKTAQEEKERTESEAKAKADEEKRKSEEALAAQQAADKKLAEEQAAVAAAAEEADASEKREKEAQTKHDEAEEARKAVDSEVHVSLTTPAASTVPSPAASPRLGGAASLPPKPQATPSASRVFPTVDTSAATTSPALSEDKTPSRAAASLTKAQPISDLTSITYPESAQAPQPALNSDAQNGKYRYDRDFLLQFAEVCKEKPESLPNLEDIGLEADNGGSGFGSSRGGPRSARSGMGPPSARSGTGLGIPGIAGGRQGFPTQGMGSFTMGTFGSGGSLRGTDSEARYKASLSRGGMARTPSQAGPGLGGLPPMGGSSSRGGPRNRGLRRGTQDPRASQIDDGTAPLVTSQNAWVRTRGADNDESSPIYVERKVKALLNKLTAENFDSISKQILDWANKSKNETDGFTLKLVIKLIFEKATDEAHWSAMYARLCKLMHESLDEGVHETIEGRDMAGGHLFRKYLLNRCQMDFEAGWKAREDAATAAAAKSEEDQKQLAKQAKEAEEGGDKSGEAVMLSDEYYIAQKAKRRGLGLVQLVGELYKAEMIGKGVIKTCFLKLLGNVDTPDEEDIESACKLLTTVGPMYEEQSRENVAVVMERLQMVIKGETLPSRIKFMVLDMIDLKREGWKSRNKQAGVMTIQEIHELAAKEQVQKAQAAAQAQRESVSRGGSMAGRSRGQIGEWQNVGAGGARAPQRPADMSGLGRISSAGLPAAPSFGGPTSVFANRRGAATRPGATPPLSRQPSSTNIATNSNIFNALNQLGAESTDAGANADRRGSADAQTPTDGAQRPKLNLQPRTKPLPGQEGEDDAAEEEPEAVKPAADDTAQLDTDMKELWGEKDAGGTRDPEEIVHFFTKRADAVKVQLAERLVADVFRIAKIKDADVVANGFRSATEQGVVSNEVLKAGIAAKMVSLDDEAIDFPNAYKAMAILLRSTDVTDDEVIELAGKIDAFEPVTPPLERLQQALIKVDEEASA